MPAEGEHGQGDQGVGVGEAEGDAGEESDLGVDRFDESVGQAVFDGGQDLGAVGEDAALEGDERFDAAAPCPGDPPVQCLAGLVDGEFEDRP